MPSYEVLAEESYKQLSSLLEWFSHFSLIPTLIGGWAVFVYDSYFGSVDIDLVGPSMGVLLGYVSLNQKNIRFANLKFVTSHLFPNRYCVFISSIRRACNFIISVLSFAFA